MLLGLLPLHGSSYYSRVQRWLNLKVYDLLLQIPEVECLTSTSCWSWLSKDHAHHAVERQRGTEQLKPFLLPNVSRESLRETVLRYKAVALALSQIARLVPETEE